MTAKKPSGLFGFGKIEIVHREQSPEELATWNRWTRFTEAAMVAPDVERNSEWLAQRYTRETGKNITPQEVEAMMPENHPDYGSWR